MNIVLSIRSLDIGGAERQFIELVKHIDKKRFDVLVCTMYGGEQEKIVKNISDIRYINLQKKGRYDFYDFYRRYKQILKEFDPDVIYSFLGEMNLFSLWSKPKRTKIIWGFRDSNKDINKLETVSKILFYLQKKMSKSVDAIIVNSFSGLNYYKNHNFDMTRATVIHNGIDTSYFQKKGTKSNNKISIGIVARIEQIKGYIIFSKAIKKILDEFNNIEVFAVGGGNEKLKKECEKILEKYNNTKFFWLGNQKDMLSVYNKLDIVVSSSLGEGFSNSIAEAMSCEVPCVVTDVGDSEIIVGDAGIVVKPNDINALYYGIKNMLKKDIKLLGQKSRKRVKENFSIEKMIAKTQKEILKCAE